MTFSKYPIAALALRAGLLSAGGAQAAPIRWCTAPSPRRNRSTRSSPAPWPTFIATSQVLYNRLVTLRSL
ncbi:hypothetical protein M8494_21760 [Serratia ureilytica]